MKNIIYIFLILFFNTTFLLAHNITFNKEEKDYIKNNEVTIALLHDFYPFTIYENYKHKGITVELIKLIAQKSNLKIKFTSNAWNRNFDDFINKRVDIISEISYTQERAKYIDFTKPYFETALHIYANTNITDYKESLESLKGKKFGILKNIFYRKQVEELNLFEIIEFNTYEEKLEALEKNEIDITFGKILNSTKIINETNYNKIKILDEVKLENLKKEDLRFAVLKENTILSNIITKTFDHITANELNNIKHKWLASYPKSVAMTYETEVTLEKKEQDYLLNKKVINFCNNPNYAPLSFINNKGYTEGIVPDTTNIIKKKLNNIVNINHITSTSVEHAYELLNDGTCDVLSLKTSFNENENFIFTHSYLEYKPVLITRDTEPFIFSLENIKYKGIAIGNNPTAIALLKKEFPGINLIETKTTKEAFEKVSSGEIYATVALLPIASYNISKYGLTNLKIAGHDNKNLSFSMALKKEDELLHSILNKALDSITTREKAEIFNTWANITYDTKIDFSKLFNIAVFSVIIIIFLIHRQITLSTINRKLEESNLQFKAIFESTVESVIISDNEGIIVDCNKTSPILFGYEKEELIGKNIESIVSKEFLNEENNSITKEIEVARKDLTLVPILIRKAEIFRNGKKHLVTISLDLSQLKKTQKALEFLNRQLAIKVKEEVEKNKQKDLKLVQQARHAQMGELISMIAHQWRQPLNAIATTIMNIEFQISFNNYNLENARDRQDFLHFINTQITNIDDLIQTLSTTIDDFRNFYKADKTTQITCVNKSVNKTLNIIKALIISKQIELDLNLSSTKDIELFESELLQVFLNIIKNAQDNFDDKNTANPRITINTKDTKEGVTVEILDNGGGIKADIIPYIFDPYFSTKSVKHGTGLGLYMSKTIIEDHHKGKLSVSNQGDGVCFIIKLKNEIKQDKSLA